MEAGRWAKYSAVGSKRSTGERRFVSQIQGRTYANIFGLVERFINAKVLELSHEHWFGDQVALEALVRFSDEELKHEQLVGAMWSHPRQASRQRRWTMGVTRSDRWPETWLRAHGPASRRAVPCRSHHRAENAHRCLPAAWLNLSSAPHRADVRRHRANMQRRGQGVRAMWRPVGDWCISPCRAAAAG